MKRKGKGGATVFNRHLPSGSVLRMKGRCQDLYFHEVPREPKVKNPRINLTFRRYKTT